MSELIKGFSRRTLRPKVPNCPTRGCARPEFGILFGFVPPVDGLRGTLNVPTRFGLIALAPPSNDGSVRLTLVPGIASVPERMLMGKPLWAEKMPANSQPPSKRFMVLLLKCLLLERKSWVMATRSGTSNWDTARLLRLLLGFCCAAVSVSRTPRASEESSMDFDQV